MQLSEFNADRAAELVSPGRCMIYFVFQNLKDDLPVIILRLNKEQQLIKISRRCSGSGKPLSPPPSSIPAMANIETGYAYQLSLARHPKTILLLAVRYSIGQVYRKSGYNAMVQRYIATCVSVLLHCQLH